MAKKLPEGWLKDGENLIKWFDNHYKWALNEEEALKLDAEWALRKVDVLPEVERAPETPADPNQTAPLDTPKTTEGE